MPDYYDIVVGDGKYTYRMEIGTDRLQVVLKDGEPWMTPSENSGCAFALLNEIIALKGKIEELENKGPPPVESTPVDLAVSDLRHLFFAAMWHHGQWMQEEQKPRTHMSAELPEDLRQIKCDAETSADRFLKHLAVFLEPFDPPLPEPLSTPLCTSPDKATRIWNRRRPVQTPGEPRSGISGDT